ncbi:hypothetical protein Theam_1439 [Thermovibrio ammonificans HB-1]|uniref:Magnesium transporter MgtE intracellular domain-containing protein n=1 Tax=Thermovibrio ammonificans (strain DSM 15698 / JCM 12110 / HB-1) TaxID=648996 RepID=E8T472_THEA1|nr:hypothetical protein [Thermovibrio ammonificans]ADU97401.1 hypothetical protein Theam_1439 [Thermovibrio ammonificans HB-1]
MRGSFTKLLAAAVAVNLATSTAALAQKAQKVEIEKELKRLEQMRKQVKVLIQENRKLLQKIEAERKALEEARRELEKELKQAQSERYKKLAQMFSKMDPELAGQKISALQDPKEAALILYNMKARKAGAILDYVDPKVVSQIVKYLTTFKSAAAVCKSLQESGQQLGKTPQE